MGVAEEATADSISEAEPKEVMLATATGVSVGMLTELKVTADEIPPALVGVSTASVIEDKVGTLIDVLSPGSAEIWTIADVEVVSSTPLIRLLRI